MTLAIAGYLAACLALAVWLGWVAGITVGRILDALERWELDPADDEGQGAGK